MTFKDIKKHLADRDYLSEGYFYEKKERGNFAEKFDTAKRNVRIRFYATTNMLRIICNKMSLMEVIFISPEYGGADRVNYFPVTPTGRYL